MSSDYMVPHGDEKIMIELSVKEAIALSENVHFYKNSAVLVDAKNKVKRSVTDKLLHDEINKQDDMDLLHA